MPNYENLEVLELSKSVCLKTFSTSHQHGKAAGGEDGVVAAGAEALEVEGDVEEAEGTEVGDELFTEGGLAELGEVGEGDFDAGEVATVVADAKFGQAGAAEKLFGLVDHPH